MIAAMRTMVITVNGRIIGESALYQSLSSLICIANDTAKKTNSRLCQCILGSGTNPATDQRINRLVLKQRCQCTMAGTVAPQNMRLRNLAILDRIDLELLRFSEMLENLTIIISNC